MKKITFLTKDATQACAFLNVLKSDLEEDIPEIKFDVFHGYLSDYKERIDFLVTPGNSFGIITGGFDLAVIELLGEEIKIKVRNEINNNHFGELNVGNAIIVHKFRQASIVYSPTMRIPKRLPDDTDVPYVSTFAALGMIKRGYPWIDSVVLPAMGGGTGDVPTDIVAHQMAQAIKNVLKPTIVKNLHDEGEKRDFMIHLK